MAADGTSNSAVPAARSESRIVFLSGFAPTAHKCNEARGDTFRELSDMTTRREKALSELKIWN
jgi:hypothetical protein